MNEKHREDQLEHASDHGSTEKEGEDALTVEEKAHERRLLTKIDLVIMPLTALLYLSAYLDRGNIGNARLQGLQATLLVLLPVVCHIPIYAVTYIALSIPGTLLAKAWLPSRSISLGALIWSVAASAMAGAKNYPSIIVCRLFIGIGEAMFGQAVALYYSMWYRKDEVAKRLGFFIGAGVLAGAFGGLIAYGVAHVHTSIAHWRILFMIEGLPSVLLAICVFIFLPSIPSQSKYLTEEERDLELKRLNLDSLNEGNTGVDWKGVKRSLTDPKAWITAVLYSCMNLTLGSVSGFLPTIVKSLGYSNADAQLYTVPPYAVALVFMTSVAAISDRMKVRGLFFCVVIGGYAAIPLIMAWVSNNSPSQSQRATGLGMLNSVGQCLSILAAFIFPSREGPKWHKGFGVNLAFNLLAICISLGLTIYFRTENRKRDQREGGRPAEGTPLKFDNYDRSVGFRYTL
ncbi:Uncharacterized transporter C1683.12 [Serendipita indica DSM 11827]|nr:Uncharacterized transporter C1683.12 [Serendipita indica DSM 11827]